MKVERIVLAFGFIILLSAVWGMDINESLYPDMCKVIEGELRVYIDPLLGYTPQTVPEDIKIVPICEENCVAITMGMKEGISVSKGKIVITVPSLDENSFEEIIRTIWSAPCSEYQPVAEEAPEEVEGEINTEENITISPVYEEHTEENMSQMPTTTSTEINETGEEFEKSVEEESEQHIEKHAETNAPTGETEEKTETNEKEEEHISYSEEKENEETVYRAEDVEKEIENKLKELIEKAEEEREVPIPVFTEGAVEIEVNNVEVECRNNACIIKGSTDAISNAILVPVVETSGDKTKIVLRPAGKKAEPQMVLDVKKPVADVVDLNKTIVSEIALPKPDENKVALYYAAKGYIPVVVDIRIPKAYVDDINKIVGEVVFLDPDPVLRLHLSARDGNVDVKKVEILGISELNITRRISFATCTVYVDNVRISYDKEGEKYRLTLRFQVMDDGMPIYLRDLRVRLDGREIFPQFDAESKEYMAVASTTDGKHALEIVGRVPGCADVDFKKEITVSEKTNPWIIAAITLLVVTGILYGIWRAVD